MSFQQVLQFRVDRPAAVLAPVFVVAARRINAVKLAIDEVLNNTFPLEKPAINASNVPKQGEAFVAFDPDRGANANEVLSANQVVKMGYSHGELKMLSNVADMYRKATGCSLADAQKAALDPKSDARRLYRYGGQFMLSAENFNKGLALISDFKTWYSDYYINGEGSKNSMVRLDKDAMLSVEKFVFEEIACNPKFSIDTPNKTDLFSSKNNLAMKFIEANMMESVSGTLLGISPEKRSVVFALANALHDTVEDGTKFFRNNLLVSRTLANFPKAAELVYSGKLNRETAFNTLFPDLKSIGIDTSMTNREIKNEIITFEEFDGEMAKAMEKQMSAMGTDPEAEQKYKAQYTELQAKSRNLTNMINDSGATIQECRQAALEGRRLPLAEGVANISIDFPSTSGFSDGGRIQFLSDINRATLPTLTTGGKAIDEENNVFRFVIGEQKYASKQSNNINEPDNVAIADNIANLCNANVHPIQTNAVFYALSQSALSPQMSLASHGYVADEHSPITFTLAKNEQTGDINITYQNPEGCAVKFSWTSTIDVNGKVTTTPIQIES